MKNKLAIYGAGGFGREVAVMIAQINAVKPVWEVIGFFDDGIEKGIMVDGLPVLGGMNEINLQASPLSVSMAVADPTVRHALIKKIINPHITFPHLVHPSAILGCEKNKLGYGCIVTAGVILTTGIEFADFCIINLASTIGHDVKLGSCCTIMPGCSISGNVSIGQRCLLGTGSRIIQGIAIGDNCIIGAGAVVTKTFGDHLQLMGVPARQKK